MLVLDEKKIEELDYENQRVDCVIASDSVFVHCNFLNVHMEYSTFQSCEFHHCVIDGSEFHHVEVSNCSFYHCVLIGLDWNVLGNGKLIPIETIQTCSLKYNYFLKMNLTKFSFEKCQLEGCEFGECNLTGANFRGANLLDCKFIRNNLTKSDFREAVNYFIDLRENRVKGAKFSAQEVTRLLYAFEIEID